MRGWRLVWPHENYDQAGNVGTPENTRRSHGDVMLSRAESTQPDEEGDEATGRERARFFASIRDEEEWKLVGKVE